MNQQITRMLPAVMKRLPSIVMSLALLAVLAGSAAKTRADNLRPALVPWPQTLKLTHGTLPLTPQSRIVCQDPKLLPLASILAEEIQLVSGLKPAVVAGKLIYGDIALSIDPSLVKEAYRLDVGDTARVVAGNYQAVALGTVTLLQSLAVHGGEVALPRMSLQDEPKADFRGLMIDVARKYHTIQSLKDMVELCRLYKVRYLQLHLTDDQAFTFPSRAYPKLNEKPWHGGKCYTIEILQDLVAYADAHGVTIIPEYEVPGHSAAANRAMHDLFIIARTKPYEHHASINFCKAEVMQAVATIVGEMCEVFKSSPYFHIGGDEANLALADQNVDFQSAMKKYGLPNQHELYRQFLCRMNEIVKKHGKQMIVWEGFGQHGKIQIPKNIIVMSYEIRFYLPHDLVNDGYKVINASWTPLYVVNDNRRPPSEIYAWNLLQFKPFGAKAGDKGILVPRGDNVIGAQLCAWEQPERSELPNERHRVPAMVERIWNPAAGKSYDDFERRLVCSDRLLDLLLHKFTVQAEGLGSFGSNRFQRELRLTLTSSPAVKGEIHYTLDGTDPTAKSPTCGGAIRLDKTTDFKAQAFDADDKPLGCMRRTHYERQ